MPIAAEAYRLVGSRARCPHGKPDSGHFRPRRRILAIGRPQIHVLGVRSGGPIGKLVGRRSEAADHLVEAIE